MFLLPRSQATLGDSAPWWGSGSKNHRRLLIFLACWFALNVIQGIFTDLDGEEAYYATFARHLAWGYFDHPPALALFVRMGMFLFPGNLGPRFFMIVLSTATLWIGARFFEDRELPLFMLCAAALVLVQAGSFIIKTDVPLIFFATGFFYFYKLYLEGRTKVAVAALPVAIAGMILSKYHGVLLVGLTLLSNPAMIRRGSFWLIALFSALLLLPHGLWLYGHDFVTIRYHLGGRTDGGFSPWNVLGYLFMEPLVFGPIIGFILLPVALVAKPRNAFERTLRFDLAGILVFFFVASFAVRIHMHWTSIALIPVIGLAIPWIYAHANWRRLTEALAVATIVGFVPVRLYLAWDFLPNFIDRKMEITHGWPAWADDVARLAGGRNVVFIDDYCNAGKFSYYTGKPAHSFNAFWFQNTQQDLWPIEEAFRGRPAMIVSNDPLPGFETATARNGALIRYRFVDDFEEYAKVEIRPAGALPLHLQAGSAVQLPLLLTSRYAGPVTFEKAGELAPMLDYFIFRGSQPIASGKCDVLGGKKLDGELSVSIRFVPPTSAGDYQVRFSIQPGWLPPTANSRAIPLTETAAAIPLATVR